MWADLRRCTNDLRGPWLFSPASPFPIGFAEISSILLGARRAPGSTKLNYFRGYVAGREDYDLARRFLDHEDIGPENLSKTISQTLAAEHGPYGERAGLIVNGGLQWSHEIHDRLALHAEQIRALDPSPVAVDLTLFIGAYGATPFGAHIDDSTHRTIIFNLGPGAKDVRIWNRGAVEKQFGPVRNVNDPATIAMRPDEFSIAAGAAFVLPSDEFHIAYNKEVSTAATLVLDYVQDNRLAERELAFHGRKVSSDERDSAFRQLTVDHLVDMGRKRLTSNGAFRYPPPQAETKTAHLKRESVLVSDTRRPILVEAVGSEDVVYSRGRHAYARRTARAVETLMSRENLQVCDFLEIAVHDGAELTASLRMIEFLLDSRGATLHE